MSKRIVWLCALTGCNNAVPKPRRRYGQKFKRAVCDPCIRKIRRKYGIK